MIAPNLPSLYDETFSSINVGCVQKKDEVKDRSPFQQLLTKFLSVNTLQSVCPWLQDLVSMEVASPGEGEADNAPFVYRPPLPNITTRPLSTFIQVSQAG